jgi:hypothetical protein
MIISSNVHPERDMYYLGAKVIEALSASNRDHWDYIELFESLKQNHNIEFKLFILCLDWLFLINAIEKDVNGEIKKCF